LKCVPSLSKVRKIPKSPELISMKFRIIDPTPRAENMIVLAILGKFSKIAIKIGSTNVSCT